MEEKFEKFSDAWNSFIKDAEGSIDISNIISIGAKEFVDIVLDYVPTNKIPEIIATWRNNISSHLKVREHLSDISKEEKEVPPKLSSEILNIMRIIEDASSRLKYLEDEEAFEAACPIVFKLKQLNEDLCRMIWNEMTVQWLTKGEKLGWRNLLNTVSGDVMICEMKIQDYMYN